MEVWLWVAVGAREDADEVKLSAHNDKLRMGG